MTTRLREKLAEHEANVAALVEAAKEAIIRCPQGGFRPAMERALAPFVSQGAKETSEEAANAGRDEIRDEVWANAGDPEALARANGRFANREDIEFRFPGTDAWKPGKHIGKDIGATVLTIEPAGSSTAHLINRSNVRRVPVPHASNLDRG